MNPTEDFNVDEIIEQLDALRGHAHVSDDYVRFRRELLKAQAKTLAAIPAPTDTPNEADAGQGPPLLDPSAVRMDARLLAALVESIQLSVGQDGHHSAVLDRLQEAAQYEPDLLGELAHRSAFGPDQDYLDSLASRLEVSTEALVFLGRALAAPFVTKHATRIRNQPGNITVAARRETGHCPTCDAPPALAKLVGENGRRVLCCSLCGHQWGFARLACPYCGNRNQESLGKLTVPEEPARWVEVCDACQAYIKTIDTRKLPAGDRVYALVEDTGTLHLDLVAEKAAYLRRLPAVALM